MRTYCEVCELLERDYGHVCRAEDDGQGRITEFTEGVRDGIAVYRCTCCGNCRDKRLVDLDPTMAPPRPW